MRFSRLITGSALTLFVLTATLTLGKSQSPKTKSDYLFNPPCMRALDRGAVCAAANEHALDYMKTNNLTAVTVVQNVRTGALVAFVAWDPAQLDVASPLLPLSVVKLFVAASWWQHKNANGFVARDGTAVSVHEMIVSGSDQAGRLTAAELRKTIGADAIVKDLDHFGFSYGTSINDSARGEKFWAEFPAEWRDRLTPSASYHVLSASTSETEWADDLSIGEAGFTVNALSISRFLQAVGNGGVMVTPTARQELLITGQSSNARNRNINSYRVMRESAALKLQAAMRDVVQRGTAKGIAQALYDIGWSIGGKTGSSGPVGPKSDAWFAGLIFDTNAQPRFTVATFVRHGGAGGGNAAKLSADLARYLIASVDK